MLISAFRSAWDRDPSLHDVAVPALLRRLCQFEVREDIPRRIERNCAMIRAGTATGHLLERIRGLDPEDACEREARYQKSSLRAWAPAVFNGQRRKRNVTHVTCYVLDVEDGSTLSAAWGAMPEYSCVLHTSWNHTEESPRYRMVFPLAEPVPAEHWRKCWRHMYTRMVDRGLQPDPKCVNADRLYFLPAVRHELSPRASMSRNGDLLRLDWTKIPDLETVRNKVVIRSSRPGVKDYRDPAVRLELAHALGADIDGERAFHIMCPRCGRRDVYYFLEPERRLRARCNHERNCGWEGHLSELEGR